MNKENVHIWQIDIEALSTNVDFFYSYLNGDEKTRANKFRFQKDYNVFVITRAVLRTLLSQYLNLDARKLDFQYMEHGKPFLKHDTLLKFNVSHSGSMAIIGLVNNHEIGVDIEYIKKDFDVLDIAENFFSADEISRLRIKSANELYPSFYRCWTRKEAFIKAESSGLSYPLDSFSVSLDNDSEAELLSLDSNQQEKNKWKMFSFKPKKDYIAAAIVNGKVNSFEVFNWEKTEKNRNKISFEI